MEIGPIYNEKGKYGKYYINENPYLLSDEPGD
jgi:hypothetical protein